MEVNSIIKESAEKVAILERNKEITALINRNPKINGVAIIIPGCTIMDQESTIIMPKHLIQTLTQGIMAMIRQDNIAKQMEIDTLIRSLK